MFPTSLIIGRVSLQIPVSKDLEWINRKHSNYHSLYTVWFPVYWTTSLTVKFTIYIDWTATTGDWVAGKFSGQQLRLIFYLLKQVWLMAELLSPAPNRPRHSAQHYRQAFLRCAKTNLLIMLEFILRPEFSGKILARYLQTIPRLKGKYSNITTRTFVCRKLWFLERLWSL